jgi:hypothetical protein
VMALKKLLSTLRPHAIRDGFPASPGQVSITKEEYGYDNNKEPAATGRTSLQKRNDRFREEANNLLRESIAGSKTDRDVKGAGRRY